MKLFMLNAGVLVAAKAWDAQYWAFGKANQIGGTNAI